MSRREEIETILAEIDKADSLAIEFGLSTRLVRRYLRRELRLLWAIEDEYRRLLVELPGGFDTPALDAYEADNA